MTAANQRHRCSFRLSAVNLKYLKTLEDNLVSQEMTPPIDPSSLIFPTAAKSINITLTQLKRANLSITNRLHSIASDATFVRSVQDHVLGQGNSQCGYKDGVKAKLPMIANERCGSWYIPADHKDGSAYFKSTDGHHGQWAFSLRRLNLQVFDAIYGRAG